MERKESHNQRKVIWTLGGLTFLSVYFIMKWWLPDSLATGIGVCIAMLIAYPFTSEPRMTSVKWIGVCLISGAVVLLMSMGGQWLSKWLPYPIAISLSYYAIFLASHYVPSPGLSSERFSFKDWLIYSIAFALPLLLWVVISL